MTAPIRTLAAVLVFVVALIGAMTAVSAAPQQSRLRPPVPEPSPDDTIHVSHPAVLTAGAVLASARRSRAAAAKADNRPRPDRKLDAPAPAPILHIRSEEELARAKHAGTEPANPQAPAPVLLVAALLLVAAIVICTALLLRIWMRARS